jgi:hypothetical protein
MEMSTMGLHADEAVRHARQGITERPQRLPARRKEKNRGVLKGRCIVRSVDAREKEVDATKRCACRARRGLGNPVTLVPLHHRKFHCLFAAMGMLSPNYIPLKEKTPAQL